MVASPIMYILCKVPASARPRRYLLDGRRFPGFGPTTDDLALAKVWNDRSSPYVFMNRHPWLKRHFIVLTVDKSEVQRAERERRKLEAGAIEREMLALHQAQHDLAIAGRKGAT